LAIAASALLGCTQHSTSAVSMGLGSAEPPPDLGQRDTGSMILASIADARRAIGLRDPLAANNDVGQALALARQAIDQVLPVGVAGGAGSLTADNAAQYLTALLGSFPARVELISAQTLLTNGDVADADATLMALQNRVPARLIPQNMPLVEAAASLEQAKKDAAFGIPQLRTQLLCAQAALHSYRGPANLTETMALASTLDRALANQAQLRTLLPAQVSIWLDTVAQWTNPVRSEG
jgi:hypothetical protein